MGKMPQEVQLAIGRIFRMASRPTEPGDIELYEQARSIILNAADGVMAPYHEPHCWARDRLMGAQGD